MEKTLITVQATIHAPVEKVWTLWTLPEHITKWNSASEEWHTPRASNDLRVGGKFTSRMEAKNGDMGFDFEGIYTNIIINELIESTLLDGRSLKIVFENENGKTTVTEIFEAETENPAELQQFGWQSILNNFKKYVEAN
jgi:uncharacterized protein YndB with AHSA1/START domain